MVATQDCPFPVWDSDPRKDLSTSLLGLGEGWDGTGPQDVCAGISVTHSTHGRSVTTGKDLDGRPECYPSLGSFYPPSSTRTTPPSTIGPPPRTSGPRSTTTFTAPPPVPPSISSGTQSPTRGDSDLKPGGPRTRRPDETRTPSRTFER